MMGQERWQVHLKGFLLRFLLKSLGNYLRPCTELSYMRCYEKCKVVQDAVDATFEISKLINYSPKRDATKLKNELPLGTPGFRVLCPTRVMVFLM